MVGATWRPGDKFFPSEIAAADYAHKVADAKKGEWRVFDTSGVNRLSEEDLRLLINVKISEGLAWPHKLRLMLEGKDNLYDQSPEVYQRLREVGSRVSPTKLKSFTLRQLRVMLSATLDDKQAKKYRDAAKRMYGSSVLTTDGNNPVHMVPSRKGAWVDVRVWVGEEDAQGLGQ